MKNEIEGSDLSLNSFARYLFAPVGYAELGMMRESLAELNAIPAIFQGRPEVVQLRLQVRVNMSMKKGNWKQALRLSRELCRMAPSIHAGFLHAGFCLRQLGKIKEAREILLASPTSMQEEPLYHYNLACYEALLGNTDEAMRCLKKSFRINKDLYQLAKIDLDLKAISNLI